MQKYSHIKLYTYCRMNECIVSSGQFSAHNECTFHSTVYSLMTCLYMCNNKPWQHSSGTSTDALRQGLRGKRMLGRRGDDGRGHTRHLISTCAVCVQPHPCDGIYPTREELHLRLPRNNLTLPAPSPLFTRSLSAPGHLS